MTVRDLRRALRLLAAALLTAGIGATGIACPSRDLVVQITPDGTRTMVLACESIRDACKGEACRSNRLLCDQETCELRNVCRLDNGAEWDAGQAMALQLLLFEVGTDAASLRDESPCVPLNLRPCIHDPKGENGCADAPVEASACLTETFDAAVGRALGSGLSYRGFHDADDGLLVAAFFRISEQQAPCDAPVLVEPRDCSAGNLVAAAGLAAPLGDRTYDVTCASCQGGSHASIGRDNGPCPWTDDLCFLQRVFRALTKAGE